MGLHPAWHRMFKLAQNRSPRVPILKRMSVLIADADPWIGLSVARCLVTSGQVVLHGFARNGASSVSHSNLFTSFEENKGKFEPKLWLARISQIIAERGIDVVLPIMGDAIRTLSEHRHTLSWAAKLPQLPNVRAFDTATDKAMIAEFLVMHGLPHPPTVVVTTGISGYEGLSALEFPVLAKPALSSGAGKGIGRLESLEGLAAFFSKQSSGERWIVQTFIEGHDVDVSVLCRDGEIVAATVQHAIKTSSKPYHWAIGIDLRIDPSALDVAERLMRKLGFSGVAHIDMRFDARRKTPLVLEVNARYWRTVLGSLNARVNFPLLACEMTLGALRANRTQQRARYFHGKGSMFLSLVGGGRLRIRPHETNLRYAAQDPLFSVSHLAKYAADAVRNRMGREFRLRPHLPLALGISLDSIALNVGPYWPC
jgi:D-aspartate ligase